MNLSKLWLIAWSTYRNQVRSTLFLIMTIALPVLAIAAGAIPIILMERSAETRLGWVDQTGQLALPDPQRLELDLLVEAYPTEEAATEALEAGEVDAFLVIPADYFQGASPIYHGERAPNQVVLGALRQTMRLAVAPDAPDWQHERLTQTAVWEYEDLATGTTLHQGIELILWYVAPAAIAVLFAFMLMTTINHMGPVISREKEDRAMEMVLTSLRPVELVGGKILGLTLLTATQAAIWGVAAVIAIGMVWINEGQTGIPRLPWGSLAWGGVLAFLGYLLYGALGAGLGILAGDREQANQLAGLLAIVGIAPLWMVGLILARPDGTIAIALTLFPLFAPVMALIRMAMTEVPVWQLWAALGLLIVSLVLALLLVARIFRAAALLYGQRLTPSQIWRALRVG